MNKYNNTDDIKELVINKEQRRSYENKYDYGI